MRIGIVGLGLIGGSLGLDLRQLQYQVFGVSRQAKTCQIALAKGVVDHASVNLELLADTDIIFICTPLGAIAPTLEKLIPHLSPETIVTDVGSVKGPIVATCSQLWPNFVGGHPMAGNADQGILAAQTDLFTGAPYVLTPDENTPQPALEQVATIARALHCQVYICPPPIHDQAVAWISHLPVMVSASLINACLGETDPDVLKLAQHLASSGFRDTSRVGGGNPELGVMMARYNRQQLKQALSQYRDSLDLVIEYIDQENWQSLADFLQATHQGRKKFLE